MTTHDIYNAKLETLQNLECFGDLNKTFTSFVIVPMNYDHDSGYRCFKVILMNNSEDEVIGIIGGGSDVINLDGIGGYGLREPNVPWVKDITPRVDWSIDCLSESGCIRVFTSNRRLCLNTNVICSAIEIFSIKKEI